MIIDGLKPNTIYFFRPISTRGALKRFGDEKTFILKPTTPPLPQQCTYLKDYLRIEDDNDPKEVIKLQSFLKNFEGFTELQITGIFDQATFDAVSAFQSKYNNEILGTWTIEGPTGYVYYTTRRQINEIYCKKAFPLTEQQLEEIEEFKDLLKRLEGTGETGTIDFGTIGQADTDTSQGGDNTTLATNDQNTETQEGEDDSNNSGQLASVAGATDENTSDDDGGIRNQIASVANSVRAGVGVLVNGIRNLLGISTK